MNWFTRIVCGRGMKVGTRADRGRVLSLLPLLIVLTSILFLSSDPATAQAPTAAAVSFGPVMTPFETIAANAPYRVCAITSLSVPCSTTGVSLFSDPNLTQPLPNPGAANTQGIISFFVAQGNYVMQVTPLPGETYVYNFILSAGGGGGTVGPGTVGTLAKFGPTTTAIQDSHINEATPGVETITQQTTISDPTCSGCAAAIDFSPGTPVPGITGHALAGSDALGNFVVNSHNTGWSIPCTPLDALCQPPTTFQTGGVNNASQTTLNLVAGTNVTITNTSGGNVTISASGGGGSYPTPETIIASSANEEDFTTCFSSSYNDYEIRASNITISGTSVTFGIQFWNGTNYDTTAANYGMGRYYVGVLSGDVAGNQPNITGIAMITPDGNGSYSTGTHFDMKLTLFNPLGSQGVKQMTYNTIGFNDLAKSDLFVLGGSYVNASPVTKFRFFSSGTFSGTLVCQPLPQ